MNGSEREEARIEVPELTSLEAKVAATGADMLRLLAAGACKCVDFGP